MPISATWVITNGNLWLSLINRGYPERGATYVFDANDATTWENYIDAQFALAVLTEDAGMNLRGYDLQVKK